MILFGIAFTVAELILIPAIIILLIFGATCIGRRSYGGASWSTLFWAVAMGWLFWPQVQAHVTADGWFVTGFELLGVWIIAGLVVSFIYWLLYCRDVRDNYDKFKETHDIRTPTGLEEFNRSLPEIFEFQSDRSWYGKSVSPADVLPPRFNMCKSMIISTAISWPVTLVHLLFNRIIDRLVNFFTSLFRGIYDAFSRLVFGKL